MSCLNSWFRVEVSDESGQIVSIESEALAGRDIGEQEKEVIRKSIDHLAGFLGGVEVLDIPHFRRTGEVRIDLPSGDAGKLVEELDARITSYLSGGGLFNPELANHDAVRDLLIDCRQALRASAAADRDGERIYSKEDAEKLCEIAIAGYKRVIGTVTEPMRIAGVTAMNEGTKMAGHLNGIGVVDAIYEAMLDTAMLASAGGDGGKG